MEVREQITLEEAEKRRSKAIEHNNRQSDLWALSLGVANGGGLIAVASPLIQKDVTQGVVALLYPSAWCFALGLIALGVARFCSLLSAGISAVGFDLMVRNARQNRKAGVGNRHAIHDGLYYAQIGSQGAAAIFFILGVLRPLLEYPMPMT